MRSGKLRARARSGHGVRVNLADFGCPARVRPGSSLREAAGSDRISPVLGKRAGAPPSYSFAAHRRSGEGNGVDEIGFEPTADEGDAKSGATCAITAWRPGSRRGAGPAGNTLKMVVGRRRVFHKRARLQQLRAFCCVARLGSITRAAEQLGLSQSAVSLHVRELEHEFNAVLLNRKGFGVSLTEAGGRCYALTEPLVKGMEGLFANFAERIAEDVTGRVDIAAGVVGAAFVLPTYIRRFRDEYPQVRLRVWNRPLDERIALLRGGEADLVLGGRERIEDMSVEYVEMLSYDTVLITSPDHPLAGCESVTPQEVAQWPMIAPPAGSYGRRVGEAAAKRLGVDAKAAVEVRGWGVIKRYVTQGLGISVMPDICLHETDQVSVISLRDHFPRRSFGIYTLRSRALTASARRLLELMIPGTARASRQRSG